MVPRARSPVALAAACALLGPLAPPVARADDGAAAPTRADDGGFAPRTALVVFVSYRGSVAVPLHPTRVRLATSRLLAEALAQQGRSVAEAPQLEPLMRHRRLRSERDLSRAFLQDVAQDLSADELVMVRLVTYDDRILLLARGMSVDGGWLRWAAAQEEVGGRELWSEPDAAMDRLESLVGAAIRRLVAAADESSPVAPAAGDDAVVALPLTAAGLGRGESDLATLCLLQSLVGARSGPVPDPALVVDDMQEGGFDPYELGPAARRKLAADFAARRLVVPRVTAFPPGTQAASGLSIPAEEGETTSRTVGRQVPVLFLLTLVDAGSGRLVAGRAQYLEPERTIGMFGRSRRARLADRYERGTRTLVHSLLDVERS
jgi:hypothetical protein